MSLAALGPYTHEMLVFCRIGTCFMVAPLFASPHALAQLRLFLAIAISLSVAPLVGSARLDTGALDSPALSARLVAGEILVGLMMGLGIRIVVSGIQLAGIVMSQVSGYATYPVSDDGSGDLGSELGALISAAVLALLFVLDFHVYLVAMMLETYGALPVGVLLDPGQALDHVNSAVGQAFNLAIRAAAPLIVAAVILNFAFGMVNRIAPQVPVIFISVPFLLASTVWLLLKLGADIASSLARNVMAILERGAPL